MRCVCQTRCSLAGRRHMQSKADSFGYGDLPEHLQILPGESGFPSNLLHQSAHSQPVQCIGVTSDCNPHRLLHHGLYSVCTSFVRDLEPTYGIFPTQTMLLCLYHSLGHSASGDQTGDLRARSFSSVLLPVHAPMVVSAPQVHLCEADGLLEFLGVSSTEFTHQPVLVAVKMLRSDVNKTAR